MKANSTPVISNQTEPHEHVNLIVEKHLRSQFKQPIAPHNQAAYQAFTSQLDGKPLIVDSGCGTGKSTLIIAKMYPEAFIVGVDKSAHRIELAKTRKTDEKAVGLSNNYCFVRSDLTDFYRLMANEGIKLYKHFILYPNPWPKKQHLQRRWHGSPVFKDILTLGGCLELRSNWRIYIEEFAIALQAANQSGVISSIIIGNEPISDFEEKYHASNHDLWKLNSTLDIDSKPMDDDNLSSAKR